MSPHRPHRPLPDLDTTPSRIERAIGTLLPGIASRLYASRMNWAMQRAYLDAAKTDRLSNWKKIGADANTVWTSDAARARERARYLVSSCSYAEAAVSSMLEATIGEGITSQILIRFSRDTAANERARSRAESAKLRWMERAGVSGEHYHDLAALHYRTKIVDGESFTRILTRTFTGAAVPLSLQVLDPTQISSWMADGIPDGHTLYQGIEYDTNGVVVAYHVLEGQYRTKSTRVPASQMLHDYRLDRPGQRRGITQFATVISDLNEINEIKHYAAIGRKVQAAIALIKTRPLGAKGGPLPRVGAPTGADTSTSEGDVIGHLTPGVILDGGEGTYHSHLPRGTEDLEPLTRLYLRGIGVGLGASYEWLTGDYSQMNFAGGRIALLKQRKTTQCDHRRHCRGFESPVHNAFIDAAVNFSDVMPAIPSRADIYAVRFSRPVFTWGVNPLQEVNAAARAIECGISNRRTEIEQLGGDFMETVTQIAEEQDVIADLGITLPQPVSATGSQATQDQRPDSADTTGGDRSNILELTA